MDSVLLGIGVSLIVGAGFFAVVYCVGASETRKVEGRYDAGTTMLTGGEAFRTIVKSRPRRGDEALSKELQRRQDALKSRREAGRG